MKKSSLSIAVSFWLLGSAAVAFAANPQTIYIKYPKTPFKPDTSLHSKSQLLSAGEEVLWQGADEKQPQWQKVEYQGKSGYVALANLSRKPPQKEFAVSANGSIQTQDPQAFGRSSAAAKALGGGALIYAEAKDSTQVAAQIFVAEIISKKVQESDDVEEHAKKNKLTENKGGAK